MALSPTTSMDFFGSQDKARRNTSLLVFYFILAAIMIVLAIYATVVGTFIGVEKHQGNDDPVTIEDLWHPQVLMVTAGVTLLIVLSGSLLKISALSGGGTSVAEMLGGKLISSNTRDPDERKLLNVVEEMAIASGFPVPPVFIMPDEPAINAFAAGFTPSDAVVAVTKGCIQKLTREELQGVIAHEFSHILNGDMRLNIRLMGILHGILIIGLIGYWIFRSMIYSGSSRSRSRKGGKETLPILLFGLIIMAIGYIGVFFGKLIKSAISRQREYLADAAAVQFTRNPDGIAGALKRIAGYNAGSKIENKRAEEASHLFFSNGLTNSFFNLMATHPPLEDRIARLDPAFLKEQAERRGTAAPSTAPAHAGAQGFAASNGAFPVKPDEIVSTVGAPTPEHIAYATNLVAAIPAHLVDLAREPFGARAIVYALLLDKSPEIRQPQIERLGSHADAQVFEQTQKLITAVAKLKHEFFLPLIDLAIPALRQLSPAQFKSFYENVDHLSVADSEISLFEYTLNRIIIRHLEPNFTKAKPPVTQYYSLPPLLADCAALLSTLAHWGATGRQDAKAAFKCGMGKLISDARFNLLAIEQAGLQAADESLKKLAAASPQIKKMVIEACASCIGADGQMTIEEAELLRAVSDSLGCPMPPVLASQEHRVS